MIKKIFSILFMFNVVLSAQESALHNYIIEGLNNNLAFKQKEFLLNKSLAALDEARGMFFPSIGINARYSRAGGGRTIDIPVGDLVNPIYHGLNQIIGAQLYPTNIPNQSVSFLREEEQETKISLVQPVFQPAIYFNYKIKSQLTEIEKAERDIFARALIAEIKTAYYNYLKTQEVCNLLYQTKELINEMLRISEVLVKNDKATIEVVYKSRAELSELEQKITEAENGKELARSYFNFLLNRPLDSQIESTNNQQANVIENINLDDLVNAALTNREELNQIKSATEIACSTIDLANSNYLPGITLAFDYGFQGEKYKFTKDYDYYMGSLVLKWNLFNGFQDKAMAEQAEWDKKKYQLQDEELKKQIILQTRQSYFNMEVADKSRQTAIDRLKYASQAFDIVSKKFKEGISPQIEYMDARIKYTEAQMNQIITEYEYNITAAELEKAIAGYSLSQLQYNNQQ
ncbi:MAG: TolC family protein [bacterium]